ncbi:TCR/Tet family MFS transporter [Sphingomonas sp. AR_OL41]|uniref:TCR/Tet family MFS transporter n=1 Tax=Sphingomonas sp. AR_OL41 TaxID=3042729 RepID=UPI0024805DE7|nr:TCR/Tet family MFS transporter [Sphingomonas sp. AR_OL41]MDH7971168.1 TCR/Tet family MFS transporter [Sphingomonas sp. AR_OL41]
MIERPMADRAMLFVGFICFIDMCGVGLVVPVLPALIARLAHVGVDRAASIGGLLLFSYAAMQFLFAPVIGGLSDRFGRRPVLLVTLFVLGCDYALMAVAPTIGWLFLGRAISGVMGATWAAANSCVADTTDTATRGRAFGVLGACGAAGFVAGPALGGLLGNWGDRVPFIAACIMALSGTVIGLIILPETLPRARRRAFTIARANPIGSLVQMRRYPVVIGFLATILTMGLATQCQLAVWSYYTILKFGWTPLTIGLSVTLFGVLVGVVQGGLSGPAFRRIGEARAGLLALACGVPAYLIFAFASASWMMIAGMLIGTMANMAFPAMQALMSRATPEDAQGELQGAIASTVAISSITGPVVMTRVFAHFADPQGVYFPGAPFLLAALLLVVAVVIFARNVRANVAAFGTGANADVADGAIADGTRHV